MALPKKTSLTMSASEFNKFMSGSNQNKSCQSKKEKDNSNSNKGKGRKKMSHNEGKFQRSAVKWFRAQYPEFNELFFSIPNGGKRNVIEASIMKAEGTVRGAPDLLFLIPAKIQDKWYTSLCIEVKSEIGKQSEFQIKWQKAAEEHGAKYIVVRDLDSFMNEINDYIKAHKASFQDFQHI